MVDIMLDKIIQILTNSNESISGQTISEQLGVSRQAVWKSINILREKGYVIESTPKKGYKFISYPDYINEESVKSFLKTNIIGKRLVVLDSTESTNEYLKSLGNQKCENGTVVVARHQSKGKGRLGREWKSNKDDCIMFSVLLRPNIAPSGVGGITPLTGLALCKALRKITGLDCMIKWPNDIIVGRKKLVGILTEMSAEFDAVDYIVIGVGINVDQTYFSEEIAHKATSVLLETGRHFNKNEILAQVIEYMENEFVENNLELTATALSQYSDMCASVGKSVTFQRGTRRVNGMAVGVAQNGELKIMLSDGTVCNVNSGEVIVQGIY